MGFQISPIRPAEQASRLKQQAQAVLSNRRKLFASVSSQKMGLLPDLLDACGASDDHMEALIADIAILTKKMSSGQTHQVLALETRRVCADALHNLLLQKMDLPLSSWFHAMMLLDVYCHSGGNVDHEDVPSLFTAIAIMLGKFEGARTVVVRNFVNSDELMCEVYGKETEILGFLQFRIRCPTLCSWFNIFLPRLGLTLIDKQWYSFFSQLCIYCLRAFVIQNVCIPDEKLRHIAQGLIGIACVATARKFGLAISQPRELPEQI
jgi:hypothetical protein